MFDKSMIFVTVADAGLQLERRPRRRFRGRFDPETAVRRGRSFPLPGGCPSRAQGRPGPTSVRHIISERVLGVGTESPDQIIHTGEHFTFIIGLIRASGS